jgi:hypothetical protein
MRLPPAPRLPKFAASEAKHSDEAHTCPVDVDQDGIPTPLLPPPLSVMRRTTSKGHMREDVERGPHADTPCIAEGEATRRSDCARGQRRDSASGGTRGRAATRGRVR